MPRYGFRRNSKAIANFLHNDPGGHARVDAVAQKNLDATGDDESFLGEPYHTDRYVRPVMVPADKQAKHGTATRALSGS